MVFSMSTANLINFFFIAVGIGVCGLCFMQITSSKHLRKEIRRYFQVFFLTLIVYISAHLARQLMDGLTGNGVRTALCIVTFLEMLAAGFMAFMMSILVLTASHVKENEKQFQIILLTLLGVHTVLLIANLFGNFIYFFDESNVYHRGPQYILSNVCPLVMLLIDSYLLIRYRDNITPHVRFAFWIYQIAPIAAIAIQSFTYGIQFIIFATVGAAVYMFSVIIRDQNERYEQQQKETARLGTELSMATDIQASQLPRLFPAFPNRPEFDVFASMDPAKEVGGDFYDFFMIDNDHIGLVMADVSGKGIPAALFMMVSRVLIKSRVQNGETPGQALANVNDQLCESNEAQLFVTVWLAVLEISTGKCIAANAGHEHPALRRAGGAYELVVYRHSPAVATMEGISFREHEFELHPGDSLFVYTDGVTEATNAEKELFGNDRLLEALNRDPDAEPEKILSNVRDGIDAFVRDAEQFDDITMLCLKYLGPDPSAE